MKTLQEIKTEILATNPSKVYFVNGEELKQTEEEFEQAVNKAAEMRLSQLIYEEELAKAAAKKLASLAKLEALGLTVEDFVTLGIKEAESEEKKDL